MSEKEGKKEIVSREKYYCLVCVFLMFSLSIQDNLSLAVSKAAGVDSARNEHIGYGRPSVHRQRW